MPKEKSGSGGFITVASVFIKELGSPQTEMDDGIGGSFYFKWYSYACESDFQHLSVKISSGYASNQFREITIYDNDEIVGSLYYLTELDIDPQFWVGFVLSYTFVVQFDTV